VNFGLSDEQELLQAEVRKFLGDRCSIDTVRLLAETEHAHSPELWKELAELGWLGMIVPEQYGGSDLGWVELAVLLIETGRSLLPAPLVASTLVAATLVDAASDEERERWLPGLVDGSTIGSVAILEESESWTPTAIGLRGEPDRDGFVLTGCKRFVSDPMTADLFLVPFRTGDGEREITVAVVEAESDGLSRKSFPSMDRTRRMGDVLFEGVRVPASQVLGPVGEGWPVVARLIDRGAVATAAEICGAAEALHRLSLEYAMDRKQFGRPIGAFQGIKHPLAEMYLEVESSKSLLYYAAWVLTHRPDEVPRAASCAKAYASEKFVRIGVDAIQIHGAVGYTDDCPVHLYFKRAKWARPSYGDSNYHFDRIVGLRGL
jgi:alkylation response protein AidB-like acyl-CoA dehydrogenase